MIFIQKANHQPKQKQQGSAQEEKIKGLVQACFGFNGAVNEAPDA